MLPYTIQSFIRLDAYAITGPPGDLVNMKNSSVYHLRLVHGLPLTATLPAVIIPLPQNRHHLLQPFHLATPEITSLTLVFTITHLSLRAEF